MSQTGFTPVVSWVQMFWAFWAIAVTESRVNTESSPFITTSCLGKDGIPVNMLPVLGYLTLSPKYLKRQDRRATLKTMKA